MKKYIVTIIMFILPMLLFSQRKLNNKYSYANLKGIKRIGVYVPYEFGYSKSLGVSYLKVMKDKNYISTNLSFFELNKEWEDITRLNLSLDYGKFLMNISKGIYVRGLVGFVGGFENKKSRMIDDKKDFIYTGINVGLESEIFLSKHIVIPIGIKQHGHFYLKKIRTNTMAYAGLRLTIN